MEQILFYPTWWSSVIAVILCFILAWIAAEVFLWNYRYIKLIIIVVGIIALLVINYCNLPLGLFVLSKLSYLVYSLWGIILGMGASLAIRIVD
jgi:hypothetical protein